MGSRKSTTITRWVKRNQLKHFCQCGCGEYIIIKREHYKKSVGIPKYLKGHNLGLPVDGTGETVSQVPEELSLWERLSDEEKERRLSQLKSFEKRENNPSWKGGRRVDENGYVQLLMPEHPFAKDGYVAEHRYVVEERTKKYDPDSPLLIDVSGQKCLSPVAVVHHVDEVKTNNFAGDGPEEIGNLMLLPNQAAHAFIHNSPLPMEERLRRIKLGIFHSAPIKKEESDDE